MHKSCKQLRVVLHYMYTLAHYMLSMLLDMCNTASI